MKTFSDLHQSDNLILALLGFMAAAFFLPVTLASAADDGKNSKILAQDNFEQWQEPGLPTGWSLRIWGIEPKIIRETEKMPKGENAFAALAYAKEGGAGLSFAIGLDGIRSAVEGIWVRFRYRTAVVDVPFTVAISGGPGRCTPSSMKYPAIVGDNKWHACELYFPVRGLPDKGVAEFLLEGAVKAGMQIEIDDVVVSSAVLPTVEARLFSPGSQVLIDQTPVQEVILELFARRASEQTPEEFQIVVFDMPRWKVTAGVSARVVGYRKQTIDFSAFAPGEYRVVVLDAKGKELADYLISKVAYKENAVWIKDHVIHVKGKPFMPIILGQVGPHVAGQVNSWPGTPATVEGMVADAKKMGFNTVYHSGIVPNKEFLDLAEKNGLMVFSENLPQAMGEVATSVGHTNVLGWSVYDEPNSILAPFCESLYRAYKKVDPYHLITSTFNTGGLGYDPYRFLDIAMPDTYSVRNDKSTVSLVSDYVKSCYTLINDDPTATVIAVLQYFTQDSTWNGFEPSIKQVRAEAYSAITAGTKGFYFYAYFSPGALEKGMAKNPDRKVWYLPESRHLYDDAATLTKELKDLEDFILLGGPCPEMKVFKKTAPPEVSPVLWRAMSLGSRKLLVVVNPTADLQKEIVLTWSKAWSDPRVLHGPQVTMENRRIALGAYEVGVYLFETSGQ